MIGKGKNNVNNKKRGTVLLHFAMTMYSFCLHDIRQCHQVRYGLRWGDALLVNVKFTLLFIVKSNDPSLIDDTLMFPRGGLVYHQRHVLRGYIIRSRYNRTLLII
jgi:hypothetical protein